MLSISPSYAIRSLPFHLTHLRIFYTASRTALLLNLRSNHTNVRLICLSPGSRDRKGVLKYDTCYAAHTREFFCIIANTHSAKHHAAVRQVFEVWRHRYYKISIPMIRGVIGECCGCEVNAPNRTESITTLIAGRKCLERVQIDFMDYRA